MTIELSSYPFVVNLISVLKITIPQIEIGDLAYCLHFTSTHYIMFFFFFFESACGLVQDSWSLDYQNVVSSSPATASVFVSLGKMLNLNLLRWPERIWYLSIVGNITI